MSTGTAAAGQAPATAHRTPAYAWLVLAMLAFIYIFNFLDRQLMSTVIESIKRDTGFTDSEMGYMTGFYFALNNFIDVGKVFTTTPRWGMRWFVGIAGTDMRS